MSAPTDKARLNPLALPSHTSLLFRLIVFQSLFIGWNAGTQWIWRHGSEPHTIEDLAFGGIAGVALVLLMSVLSYISHPFAVRASYRGSFVPLVDDQPVQSLVSPILAQFPEVNITILLSSDFSTSRAQAYGIFNRPTIIIGGRLRVLARANPELFSAIIRHECGHAVNGDVNNAYAAISFLASAFIFTFSNIALWIYFSNALDFIQSSFYSGYWLLNAKVYFGFYGPELVQNLPIIMVTLGTFALLLRQRELYADLSSIQRCNADTVLELFKKNLGSEKLSFAAVFHPSPEQRLLFLKETARYDTLSFSVGFIAGVTTGAFLMQVMEMASDFALVSGVEVDFNIQEYFDLLYIGHFWAISTAILTNVSLFFICLIIFRLIIRFWFSFFCGVRTFVATVINNTLFSALFIFGFFVGRLIEPTYLFNLDFRDGLSHFFYPFEEQTVLLEFLSFLFLTWTFTLIVGFFTKILVGCYGPVRPSKSIFGFTYCIIIYIFIQILSLALLFWALEASPELENSSLNFLFGVGILYIAFATIFWFFVVRFASRKARDGGTGLHMDRRPRWMFWTAPLG